jgi:hypothetical protein
MRGYLHDILDRIRDGIGYLLAWLLDSVWGTADSGYNLVSGGAEYARNLVRWWLGYIPDILGFARDWLEYILIDCIINPLEWLFQSPFQVVKGLIEGLWDSPSNNYTPVTIIKGKLDDLRDVILAVYDAASGLGNDVITYLTGLLEELRKTLQDGIDALWTYFWGLDTYITQTIAGDITELRYRLDAAIDNLNLVVRAVNEITADPGKWVWDNLRPGLENRIRDLLMAIW